MNSDVVDELKQPEYTGENRCLPCTIVNLAIAAVVGWLIGRKHRVAGVLAFAVSVVVIYLRGYLVPGTPTLTKRYLPPEVLRWFGKEPDPEIASGFQGVGDDGLHRPDSTTDATGADASGGPDSAEATEPSDVAENAGSDGEQTAADGDGSRDEPVDLEGYFLEHGILEPCADEDDLCLTDDFEDAWFDEIEAVDEAGITPEAIVDVFGFEVDPADLELDARDDAQLLLSSSGVAGRWPSRAAILADVAGGRALESWVDDWTAFDPETRGQVLNALRMFLERCPTGGSVSMDEEVVESCCTSHDVVAVTCDETGERLFEQRLDAVDA
ncbi:hypothetical protein [Halopiger goleimassiliensis]|uniref:hypothetical protein n=1 Tax=Halopiger goleimassiliensis TaxID=1293048 RepID=UPI000677C599|nr:hypothetical protein [Halopiger goleimassiliensis]